MNRPITSKEAWRHIELLSYEIQDVLKVCGDEADNVVRSNDLDETFLRDQVVNILNSLENIKKKVDYVNKPVIEQGFVKRNGQGRYELNSGRYFTSGSPIEVLVGQGDGQYWLNSRVEHGDDYYVIGLGKKTPLEGMMVRVRG
ncbi:DUF5348 domain-containing protein [Solibacillus silvestris]